MKWIQELILSITKVIIEILILWKKNVAHVEVHELSVNPPTNNNQDPKILPEKLEKSLVTSITPEVSLKIQVSSIIVLSLLSSAWGFYART